MKHRKVTTCAGCELNDCMGMMFSLRKHQEMGTLHPECPLEDLIDPLDVAGVKSVLFKMSKRVQVGQFDSRSFVGDIALELRSLLFKDETLFWKEYDAWEKKQK